MYMLRVYVTHISSQGIFIRVFTCIRYKGIYKCTCIIIFIRYKGICTHISSQGIFIRVFTCIRYKGNYKCTCICS